MTGVTGDAALALVAEIERIASMAPAGSKGSMTALDALAEMVTGTKPYTVSSLAPLTRTKNDGSVQQALFWLIDGRVIVHPDRVGQLESLIAAARAQLAGAGGTRGRS